MFYGFYEVPAIKSTKSIIVIRFVVYIKVKLAVRNKDDALLPVIVFPQSMARIFRDTVLIFMAALVQGIAKVFHFQM